MRDTELFRNQTPLSSLLLEGDVVQRYWYAVGTADVGTSAAAWATLFWSTRMRAFTTSDAWRTATLFASVALVPISARALSRCAAATSYTCALVSGVKLGSL